MDDSCSQSRQERREIKRHAERKRMTKHGKGLAQMYKDALLKRLDRKASMKDSQRG